MSLPDVTLPEESFLAGGGKVAAMMRGHDWSSSPLGRPDQWPQSLRSVVSLLLNSKFPMFVAWGPELGFLYNDPYAEILGAKHPAALGARFEDIWREIWPDIAPLIDAALSGEGVYRENLPLLMNRKGFDEQTWFTFSYSPVWDESGSIGGMFCAVAETTDQVLAVRRQRFRIELEEALSGIADPRVLIGRAVTALGRHLGAQRAGYARVQPDDESLVFDACFADGVEPLTDSYPLTWFGAERVARHRKGMTEVCADVEAEADDPALWRAIQTRAVVSVPLIRDGHLVATLYVNFREPHRWTEQEVALIEDVATRTWAAIEQATAENALRESEARFRALLTTGAYSVFRMSADWRELRELEGQGFLADTTEPSEDWLQTYVHPDDQPRVLAAVRQAIASRSMFESEHRIRQADGRLGWTHARAVPMLDSEGRLVEWFGAASDTTARKRGEDALRQLTAELEERIAVAVDERQAALAQVHEMQKMETIGQLTGGVAHDFNNLLTPILGALDMLARRLDGDERARRMTAGGLQAAERARTLIQRLLAFSRRQHLAPRPVDVARLLAGFSDMVSRSIGPGIRLSIACADGLPPALVDPNQLELALLNLVVNARDAMPAGGDLTVRVTQEIAGDHPRLREGRYIRFSVTDNGIGMDEQTVKRAIDPFFTTKGVGRGTGLGLPSVHGLAAQSGGDFALDSRPGRGTTATLWLPVSTEAPPIWQTSANDAAIPDVPAATVLLVDDEDLVRGGTAEMLADAGYSVVSVGSGYEALQKIHAGLAFDALVTDYAMPGMTGAELAQQVRRLHPHVPTLMITGFATLTEREAGGLPRLAKPFRQAELVGAVADLLEPTQRSA
ncbi:ATP-binding protein [Frateuria soli]|uniref:ATP-binding protein n=1 Tax=Frateuria soli TaxID=1542730 RepID=UPI001E4F1A2B|nr:ATP-binding protein [Frateuria soli]UGB37052.1 ATP-binding protein [Frateuria soli]